jgi:hypothetical protein
MAAVGAGVVSVCELLADVGEGNEGGGICTSSLVFSAIILWNPIPTPSMTARSMAQPIAEFLAAFAPPRIANAPPVKNPAMTIASH